ncbi:hypothetical protein BJ165DRAFT_1395751, partial [Panaeolus papilionaceus]
MENNLINPSTSSILSPSALPRPSSSSFSFITPSPSSHSQPRELHRPQCRPPSSLNNKYSSRFATLLKEGQASALVANEVLRPKVPAAQRLTRWSSPYSIRQRAALESQLPPSLVDQTYNAIVEAIAPSTRSVYGAGILRFHQFCDSFSIPEEDRMPASAPLLAAFVAHCKGSYEGKTIGSWLSGIRQWHVTHRAAWNGDNAWVGQARMVARKQGTHHKRPLRAPVSIDHLHALRKSLNPSNPYDAATWAVATTTFFGCRRLGETTVKSPSSFNPLYNVTCASADVTYRTICDSENISVSIRIPWTKSTKQEGASIHLTSRNNELCPVRALLTHLSVNRDCPPEMSFFAYRDSHGRWCHLLKDKFISTINGIWSKTSLDHVSGHSFRIGGAVTLLLAVVAATGGWSSLAFLLYWRRMEEIIPMCTSRAYARAQSQLSSAMEEFRIRHSVSSDTISDSNT